jgi:hypothetical protein
MTTRELINKVLRGLRQFGLLLDAADTSTTDDYLLMILQFVNEAKEEIEEAGWPWQALRQTVTLTLASGQVQYDILSTGEADVDTNDRSRLLYETVSSNGSTENFRIASASLPQVFDVTTSAENRLKEWTQEKMERVHMTDNDETGQPTHFALWSDGDSIKLKVYPTPDGTYTIKLRMYIPQAELTESDLTTTLSIPSRPVWTKALFKANQERGDELGKEGSALHQTYMDAHGSAAGKEMTPADSTVSLER